MKPYEHSKLHVKKYGGQESDYLPIDDLMDFSKSAHATMKHRALFHHSLGPYIMEKVFGTNITNSDGKLVSVRDIAEDHILHDLRDIPSFDKWMECMTLEPWMGQPITKTTHYPLVD